MHLKMKTGLSGPAYNFQPGAEVPFDADFPFTPGEVRRFTDPDGADIADYVGEAGDLDAWFEAQGEALPALYGSSILPAIVEIGGYKVQLGGLVGAAFESFAAVIGGKVSDRAAIDAWNELPETAREEALATLVEQLTAEPAGVPNVVAEASIVERPAAPEKAPTEDTPAAPAPVELAKPAAPKKTAAKKG